MLEIISVLWQLCEPSLLTGKIFSIDVMHQLAVQLRNTSYGVHVYVYNNNNNNTGKKGKCL